MCHEPTACQDLPGDGRASNADQLPAAVRDKHRLQFGWLSTVTGVWGMTRLRPPVRVPQNHPQRDPAPCREAQRCQRHVKPEPEHLFPYVTALVRRLTSACQPGLAARLRRD
jgi:hypothetical protein